MYFEEDTLPLMTPSRSFRPHPDAVRISQILQTDPYRQAGAQVNHKAVIGLLRRRRRGRILLGPGEGVVGGATRLGRRTGLGGPRA